MVYKQIIFLMLTILCSIVVVAQKADKLLYKVTYSFKHVYDTLNPANVYMNDMVLNITNNYANYLTAENDVSLQNAAKTNNSSINKPSNKTATGYPIVIVNQTNNDEMFFQLKNQNKVVEIIPVGNQFYAIEEPFNKINWQITHTTKTILGYKCQKATATFKGRNYDAWFTTGLPFNYGPWKLCGLPGLIVEAYDSKNEVVFVVKDIIKVNNEEYVDFFEKERVVVTTRKKIIKAQQQFNADPASYASAVYNNKEISKIPVYYKTDNTNNLKEVKDVNTNHQKKIINNPIELRE